MKLVKLGLMSAVPFDALKLARKLEASGMGNAMAAGTAEALAEAMSGAELATKADVAVTNAAVATLRVELKSDISNLRTELKTEIGSSRTEFKLDLELLRRDIIIKLGSMLVISVGILLTAFRYFPHP